MTAKENMNNPLEFGLFTRMHLVKKVASGIPRMQEAMKEAGSPEPEFNTNGIFTAVFKRKYSIMNDTVNDTVNEKEKKVLSLLKKTGRIKYNGDSTETRKEHPGREAIP